MYDRAGDNEDGIGCCEGFAKDACQHGGCCKKGRGTELEFVSKVGGFKIEGIEVGKIGGNDKGPARIGWRRSRKIEVGSCRIGNRGVF